MVKVTLAGAFGATPLRALWKGHPPRGALASIIGGPQKFWLLTSSLVEESPVGLFNRWASP